MAVVLAENICFILIRTLLKYRVCKFEREDQDENGGGKEVIFTEHQYREFERGVFILLL